MSTEFENHERYMRRCLFLANHGELLTAPNPMVGAVVVGPDGRILGEGYHICAGQAHAEVHALENVCPADRQLLPLSTLYVSLEPCSHWGRTPPCADLIVRSGIRRVVVGCQDPFEHVDGSGIKKLRDAGVEVIVGVLEDECRRLNRRFITFHTKKRPYIVLKWAVSQDGFLDRWRDEASPQPPVRLSSALSSLRCQHQRALASAILVGHHTLTLDRPRLTNRAWAGHSPVRVVLGRVDESELPAGWRCYADVDTLLSALHADGLQSLMVEGGAQTLQTFIDAGLWDEAQEERAPLILGSGVPAPRMPRGVERDLFCRFGRVFTHWTNS